MKTCEKCKKELLETYFEKQGDNLRKKCKLCRKEELKVRREQIKELNANRLEFIEEKQCRVCSEIKPRESFNRKGHTKDGLDSACKECYTKIRKPKEQKRPKQTPLTKFCEKCSTEKSSTHFKKTNRAKDGLYSICIDCWKPCEWNSEKQKQSEKRYCEKNKEKLQEKWKRRSMKLQCILKQRLSARIKSAFNLQSLRKNAKTYEYIGCSYDFLKKWFEFQFKDGMSWETMGKWHIDHVKPCESFDLTNEKESNECFNWKNLRPCWAEENQKKSSHIIPELIESHIQLANNFMKSHYQTILVTEIAAPSN